MVHDEIIFYGHPNIQGLHSKAIEITKDNHLSPRGDCIIGVRASKGCHDLDPALKSKLRQKTTLIRIDIIVDGKSFSLSGKGDDRISLTDKNDVVIRKTDFVCPRTLSVKCDKASSDIPRDMIELLVQPGSKGIFRITAE